MEIGIKENTTDTYIQEISIKRVAGFNTKRKLADGTPGPAHAGDFRHDFEIRWIGTPSETAGAELATTLSSLSGGATHIRSTNHGQKFGDVDEFSVSGTHWPGATIGV